MNLNDISTASVEQLEARLPNLGRFALERLLIEKELERRNRKE